MLSLQLLSGFIPAGALTVSAARFAIGDIVGVIASMPLIWVLASHPGRSMLARVLRNWELALGCWHLVDCTLRGCLAHLSSKIASAALSGSENR